MYKRIAIVFMFSFLVMSCQKEDGIVFEPEFLDEYSTISSLSKESIISMLSQNGFLPTEAAVFIKYGVKVVRITYNTVSHENEQIKASGVLIIPESSNPMPFVSFQHGTITEDSYAPSYYQSAYTDFATIYSSTGFIIAVPDYLGYGSSNHINHPYEHRVSLATACRDMIRASYEYFKVNDLNQPSDKLFLTGYSEGGFATMATYKLLQEQHSNEFTITAVTVGAGAYNKTEFADWVMNSNQNLQHINSFVWVLNTYNSIYSQLNRPLNYYYNDTWASIIENQGVFATIESNPQLLFNQDFIENFTSGNDSQLNEVFADNNCFDWKPLSPLRLYHGTADLYVPYFNSLSAYNAMMEYNPPNVELVTVEGGDHVSTLSDYTVGTFLFFQQFLNN